MAQKGVEIVVAIIPPDSPGTSFRSVYDPDLKPGLLAYEVGQSVKRAVNKLNKKPKPTPEVPA